MIEHAPSLARILPPGKRAFQPSGGELFLEELLRLIYVPNTV